MANVSLDLKKDLGAIKLMNCVNNGPTAPNVRKSPTSFDGYKALEIPFARNHDAAFFGGYGGEHTVDVHRIFRNFDADENDPESYIFEPTDKYVKTTMAAGTKVFYRLGAAIEHDFKFGTRVPKDFAKWARICEHIIRHFNEGWANGMEVGIEYWEIWNEPDCRNADGSNPCWQGTEEQFIDLYRVTSKHLKACFPNLKIGGPAFTGCWPTPFKDAFLDTVAKEKLPLDFYSYHWYGKNVTDIGLSMQKARDELDKRGLTDTITILNEWNYIRGWMAEDWRYSLASERGLKGSSFIAGVMCMGQEKPLDMLMYYDARPCGMNGIFAQETYLPLKGYYPFAMFRELRKLGGWKATASDDEDIYLCGAGDGKDSAVMLTYYNDDDTLGDKDVRLTVSGAEGEQKAEIYLLDADHDMTLMSEQYFTAEKFTLHLKMSLFSTVLVKFTK